MASRRFDQIDNFAAGQGTNLYLPATVQGATTFLSQNGGTAVLTTTSGGTAGDLRIKYGRLNCPAAFHFLTTLFLIRGAAAALVGGRIRTNPLPLLPDD
jgi:hypothetical protein